MHLKCLSLPCSSILLLQRKERKPEFMPGKTIKRQRYLFEIASPPSLLIIHFEMRSPSKQMKQSNFYNLSSYRSQSDTFGFGQHLECCRLPCLPLNGAQLWIWSRSRTRYFGQISKQHCTYPSQRNVGWKKKQKC